MPGSWKITGNETLHDYQKRKNCIYSLHDSKGLKKDSEANTKVSKTERVSAVEQKSKHEFFKLRYSQPQGGLKCISKVQEGRNKQARHKQDKHSTY